MKAYAQLMRSMRREKSDATIIYQLLIFIIFPMYPCVTLAQNLAVALWRRVLRTVHRHHLSLNFWSNVAGLHVATVDGSSEPFSAYRGWRAEAHPLNNLLARLGHGLVLALTTVQSVGMFVRLLCRLIRLRGYRPFDGFAVADFEAFQISIGMLAILFMSWSAWALNVAWAEDPETLPGPKRLHSERFWASSSQTAAKSLRWILVRGSLLGVAGLAMFYAIAAMDYYRWVSPKLPSWQMSFLTLQNTACSTIGQSSKANSSNANR